MYYYFINEIYNLELLTTFIIIIYNIYDTPISSSGSSISSIISSNISYTNIIKGKVKFPKGVHGERETGYFMKVCITRPSCLTVDFEGEIQISQFQIISNVHFNH